jgi:hypothetical protein
MVTPPHYRDWNYSWLRVELETSLMKDVVREPASPLDPCDGLSGRVARVCHITFAMVLLVSDRFRFDTKTLPVILLGLLLQSYMIRDHSKVQLVLWCRSVTGQPGAEARRCQEFPGLGETHCSPPE